MLKEQVRRRAVYARA